MLFRITIREYCINDCFRTQEQFLFHGLYGPLHFRIIVIEEDARSLESPADNVIDVELSQAGTQTGNSGCVG
jgi:hypothetical protein